MAKLPDAHDLFQRFFRPHISKADLDARLLSGVLPDIARMTALQGAQHENSKASADLTTSEHRLNAILRTSQRTWPSRYSASGPLGICWVRSFDQHFTRAAIKRLISESDPAIAESAYATTALEFGAVMAMTFLTYVPDLTWSIEQPLCDSALYDELTETRINVFHWAIKKLSAYGVEDEYPQKVCACLRWLRGDEPFQAAQRALRAAAA